MLYFYFPYTSLSSFYTKLYHSSLFFLFSISPPFIISLSPFIISIPPPFCHKCQRTIWIHNIYKVTPKWDRKSWCTFRIVEKVLSHNSCKIWHGKKAIWTSTDSCIMWSATEKFWSWTNDLQCAIWFCIVPIIGKIMF